MGIASGAGSRARAASGLALQVRGFTLLSDLEHLRETLGEAGYEALLAELPPADRAACAALTPLGWSPVALFDRLVTAGAARLGLPEAALCARLGERLADKHLIAMLHHSPRPTSPEILFLSAEYIYVSLYNRGKVQVRAGRNGQRFVEITDAPLDTPFNCLRNLGFGRRALALSGAHAAQVHHPACCAEGADKCVYELSWS